MSVFLIRHGETSWNKAYIMQGRVDIELNEVGKSQANEARAEMENIPIDICFVSPLKRARQTAEIVLSGREVPLLVEPRLIEMAYGEYEGMSRSEECYLRQRRKLAHRYPKGESYLDVAQRVYNLLDEIKANHRDENVLLVCHGGVGRLIRSYFIDDLENDDFFDTIIPNGKPIRFEFSDREIPLIENPVAD